MDTDVKKGMGRGGTTLRGLDAREGIAFRQGSKTRAGGRQRVQWTRIDTNVWRGKRGGEGLRERGRREPQMDTDGEGIHHGGAEARRLDTGGGSRTAPPLRRGRTVRSHLSGGVHGLELSSCSCLSPPSDGGNLSVPPSSEAPQIDAIPPPCLRASSAAGGEPI